MDRFSAAGADERRRLFADAVRAHRERESPFLTVEADRDATPVEERRAGGGDGDGNAGGGDHGEDGGGADGNGGEGSLGAPWIQFANGVVNLDCTEAELDRLKALLESFPSFQIEELVRPEEAEGVNVNVSAYADEERVAEFVDRTFREVYGQPADYRLWATAI